MNLSALATLVFLLALTAGFYWKLTISREWTFLESPDQADVVRPWLDFQAREFHAGRFPLWDPYEWAGHSLIGQVQPGITNPLNWILFAMPLRDGHIPIATLHWYWVLIHWLAAVFCYALCRDWNCGYWASLLGASIFALTGFVGHTDWPQILMTSIWVPVVLLFFGRVVRGVRPRGSAALCGAALGMAFLSGHHVVPVFTAVLMGGLWGWHVLSRWRSLPRWGHAALFALVWLLVSAAQVLPAIEYAKQAVRWAGAPEPLRWGEKVPYSVHAEYSLHARDIPGMVIPGPSVHVNPFVGTVALALALAAIAYGWRSGKVRLMAAVAVGGLLLALGPAFPPYRAIYALVPMVEKAREPAFAIVLFQVGVAVLAAFGLDAWREGRRSKGLRRWSGAAILTLFLVEAVTDAPRLARFDRPGSYFKTVVDQRDIARFLQAQPGWFRVELDDAEVPYNFGDLYGIEQFGGTVSSMNVRTHRMLGQQETPRLFGIQYRVARKPANAAQVEVFQSGSGLKVFRDPGIGEPLWTVPDPPCASGTPEKRSGADRLQVDRVQVDRVQVDRVQVVSRLPEAFVVDAEMACPGLLVAGDAWYTGWAAWVDGRRVRVEQAEGAVRAVRVPAGKHRVEFRYRPGSVYWGVGLTALGLVLAAIAVLKEAP